MKEFQPRSFCEDVKNEAAIVASFVHPFLFGMCTKSRPHRIVLQFHGIDSETITLHRELMEHTLGVEGSMAWLIICVQLLEAIEYIHTKNILHNDI